MAVCLPVWAASTAPFAGNKKLPAGECLTCMYVYIYVYMRAYIHSY